MQQNHMAGRMMQKFFPATRGCTCFFPISLGKIVQHNPRNIPLAKKMCISLEHLAQTVLFRFCHQEILKMLNESTILSRILAVIHTAAHMSCTTKSIVGCSWVHRPKMLMKKGCLFNVAMNHTECFITHLMTRDEQIDFVSRCPSIAVGKAIVGDQNKTENIQFILWLTKGFVSFLNASFSLFISYWSYISKQNLEIIQFVHLLDFFPHSFFGKMLHQINTSNFGQSFLPSVNKLLS